MTHRIRKAMVDGTGFLDGIVEIDETYIGGKSKRPGRSLKTQKPRNEKFDMVIGISRTVETGPEHGWQVWQNWPREVCPHPRWHEESIKAAVDANVSPWVDRIYTDSAAVYDFSFDKAMKSKHRKVNHTIQWVVPNTRIHTNTVESSFSLLKRGLIGSFHRVSIKHLHRYLSEFEFRFNVRKDDDRFSATLKRMLGIPPMPYVELIAEPKF